MRRHISLKKNINNDIKRPKTKLDNFWLPFFLAIIALAGIASGLITNKINNDYFYKMKEFEVTFKSKQDNYSLFMQNLSKAFYSSYRKERSEMTMYLDEIEIIFYCLEPFFDDESKKQVWDSIQQFNGLCFKTIERDNTSKENNDNYFDSFRWYKNHFRKRLYPLLFKKYIDLPLSFQK